MLGTRIKHKRKLNGYAQSNLQAAEKKVGL